MRLRRYILGLIGLSCIAVVAASCATAETPTGGCADPQVTCGSSCVTLATDTENCGACGTVCPPTEACVSGACTLQCPTNNLKCAKDGGVATCVNAKTDNANCGGCGNVCKAGEICFGGACSGTCGDAKDGQTTCGADGGTPYCANLQADQQNCGSCGKPCASTELCVAGVCQGSCDTAQTVCPGNGDGGSFCADLMTDNQNCGACGVPCNTALHSCINGSCTNECTSTQMMCSDGGTSYCVDSLTDNHNCGACGNSCTSAKPICSGGTCTTITGGGTVRYTNGTITNVTYMPCGNGTNTNCTEAVAESSCTGIGLKLVSHASDGTTGVVSLGATVSCEWDISYFTNSNSSVAGQCLVGISNAKWSGCCGLSDWHGNIVTVPSTLNQQFGYVSSGDSGYNGGLTNTSGTTWGCQTNATAVPPRGGCTTYYVACM